MILFARLVKISEERTVEEIKFQLNRLIRLTSNSKNLGRTKSHSIVREIQQLILCSRSKMLKLDFDPYLCRHAIVLGNIGSTLKWMTKGRLNGKPKLPMSF